MRDIIWGVVTTGGDIALFLCIVFNKEIDATVYRWLGRKADDK